MPSQRQPGIHSPQTQQNKILKKYIPKFLSKIACQAPKLTNQKKTKDITIAKELSPLRYN
jgi:hypothetical protein